MVGSMGPRCETVRGVHWPKKGREVVWNSRRGNHLGQRSRTASTGRTYGCKRSDQTLKNSCGTGAVHIWIPGSRFARPGMTFLSARRDTNEPPLASSPDSASALPGTSDLSPQAGRGEEPVRTARIQTPAHLLSLARAKVFQPGRKGDRHGQGSDAQQQGKEETEGRQEPQKGRRGAGQSVRGGQDAGGPEPQQQEMIAFVVMPGHRGLPCADHANLSAMPGIHVLTV